MESTTIQFETMLPSGSKQNATFYCFEKAGEEIPLHDHKFWHNCMVIAGSVEIYDGTGNSIIQNAGNCIEFAAGRTHAIKAIEDGTMIVNLVEPGAKIGNCAEPDVNRSIVIDTAGN